MVIFLLVVESDTGAVWEQWHVRTNMLCWEILNSLLWLECRMEAWSMVIYYFQIILNPPVYVQCHHLNEDVL